MKLSFASFFLNLQKIFSGSLEINKYFWCEICLHHKSNVSNSGLSQIAPDICISDHLPWHLWKYTPPFLRSFFGRFVVTSTQYSSFCIVRLHLIAPAYARNLKLRVHYYITYDFLILFIFLPFYFFFNHSAFWLDESRLLLKNQAAVDEFFAIFIPTFRFFNKIFAWKIWFTFLGLENISCRNFKICEYI